VLDTPSSSTTDHAARFVEASGIAARARSPQSLVGCAQSWLRTTGFDTIQVRHPDGPGGPSNTALEIIGLPLSLTTVHFAHRTVERWCAVAFRRRRAAASNSLEWLFQASSNDRDEDRFGPFFRGVGAMTMGSTTYEWILEHEQLLDHPSKWQGMYGQTPCWVFTHRELPMIPGANLSFVRANQDGQFVHLVYEVARAR
jgi:hypothetical protein